jgi:hypothetical protein
MAPDKSTIRLIGGTLLCTKKGARLWKSPMRSSLEARSSVGGHDN